MRPRRDRDAHERRRAIATAEGGQLDGFSHVRLNATSGDLVARPHELDPRIRTPQLLKSAYASSAVGSLLAEQEKIIE